MSFLGNLKVGDTVIVITLESGGRFRKNDGFPVGGGVWNLGRLREATEEEVAALNERKARQDMARFLSRFAWQTLDTADLETVVGIAKKAEKQLAT